MGTTLIWCPHQSERSEFTLVGILVPCCRFGAPLFGVRWGGGGGGGGHFPPGQTSTVVPTCYTPLLPEATSPP